MTHGEDEADTDRSRYQAAYKSLQNSLLFVRKNLNKNKFFDG